MSWSSGKDSAAALHLARADPSITVTGLLVTMNADAGRVAMHGVRRALVDGQADRLGLPLHVVDLPSPCPNEIYEQRMTAALEVAVEEDVEAVVFGDLFLEDVRAYREQALAATPIEPVFPLWARPTAALAREMVTTGIRAVLTCVDSAQMPASFVGRAFDDALLDELPSDIDPCGENGEFHTFVHEAPGFTSPIEVQVGEVVTRDQFVFCDLVPRPPGQTG
jgi:uncharacterized protein (TIGR00290 family)